jgi:hypothetical protein
MDRSQPGGALEAASQSKSMAHLVMPRGNFREAACLVDSPEPQCLLELPSAPVLTADHLPNRGHGWILQDKTVNTYFAIH